MAKSQFAGLPHDQHPLWPKFVQYATDKGINLEAEEDWLAWWDCFLAGVTAEYEHLRG